MTWDVYNRGLNNMGTKPWVDWIGISFFLLAFVRFQKKAMLPLNSPPFFLFRSGFCRFLSFKTGRWVAGSFFFFTDDTVDG